MQNHVTAGNEFSLARRNLRDGGKHEKSKKAKTRKKIKHMKTKIISRLLILALVFVLGGAITQVRGQGLVTIRSIGDVARGETGSFEVRMNPAPEWVAAVNFSVSGTAIPGVDYVPLLSPVIVGRGQCHPPSEHCFPIGLGVIRVTPLSDPRGQFFPQPYSVVVTLKPGLGYTIGEPSSATMVINP
jgi:hypothetical protein